MARANGFERMSFAELLDVRAHIDRLILEKKAIERDALRQKMADLARQQGLSLDDVVGKRKSKGSVPPKYRDPKNPENTWTGRVAVYEIREAW